MSQPLEFRVARLGARILRRRSGFVTEIGDPDHALKRLFKLIDATLQHPDQAWMQIAFVDLQLLFVE